MRRSLLEAGTVCCALGVAACMTQRRVEVINGEERTLDCMSSANDSYKAHCFDRESNEQRSDRLTHCALTAAHRGDCASAARLRYHLQFVASEYDHSALDRNPEVVRCNTARRRPLPSIELPRDPIEASTVDTLRIDAAMGNCDVVASAIVHVRSHNPEYFRRVLAHDEVIADCLQPIPEACDGPIEP